MLCKLDTQIDATFRLKFVTIVVGILDVILGSVGSCGAKNDIYFLVTVLVIFSLSFLHLMCSVLDVFKANCTSRGLDFIFHLIGGVLILIASLVILTGTSAESCRVMEKTSAATIGLFNAFIYLYICWRILRLLRKCRKSKSPSEILSKGSLPLYIFFGVGRRVLEPTTLAHSEVILRAEDLPHHQNNRKVSVASSRVQQGTIRSETQESMIVLKPVDTTSSNTTVQPYSTAPLAVVEAT